MNTLKLENKEQLDRFLKILVEESIHSAKKEQDSFESKIRDAKRYSIEEQEEEEGVKMAEPSQRKAADEPGETPEESEEERKQVASDAEEFISPEITYFSVRDQINDIRAAPSMKGKDQKREWEEWLNRLSEDEKTVFSSYLDTANKLLRSKVAGTSAVDPSSDLSITIQGDEGSSQVQSASPEQASKPQGSEDTTPPIRVGESQDISEIKRKVRNLMTG